MNEVQFRERLNAQELYLAVRSVFEEANDPRGKNCKFSLPDALLAGSAMFAFKSSSLLSFEKSLSLGATKQSLQNIFGLDDVPSDSQMREILDQVSPNAVTPAFRKIASILTETRELQKFKFNDTGYLIALDATGFFSSNNISCDHCLVKNHKDGSQSFEHQMLTAVLVHPDESVNISIPLAAEFITKEDGSKKNDCETNAAKRLLPALRDNFPKLDMIFLMDSLYSTNPIMDLLMELRVGYIVGAKPGNHKALFNTFEVMKQNGKAKYFKSTSGKVIREAWVCPRIHLNKESLFTTTLVVFQETNPKGETVTFSWVTNLPLDSKTIFAIASAGRKRWVIENETFNTLKNQGYNLEHNYGHGKKHLTNTLAVLMLIAFAIDQVCQYSCRVFQHVLKITGSKRELWNSMRSTIRILLLDDWNQLWTILAGNAYIPASAIPSLTKRRPT